MAQIKVETAAVVNRNPVGSVIKLPKATAEKLSAKGYVNIIEEVEPVKKAPVKKKPAKTKESATKS